MNIAGAYDDNFEKGDIVYAPETLYLNQKHERYNHEVWETIELIQVKITRTVFKGIANDKAAPYITACNVRFRQIFHTLSEAVECLSLHPYIIDMLKKRGADAFLNTPFNITAPDFMAYEVDAKEMEMMR